MQIDLNMYITKINKSVCISFGIYCAIRPDYYGLIINVNMLIIIISDLQRRFSSTVFKELSLELS